MKAEEEKTFPTKHRAPNPSKHKPTRASSPHLSVFGLVKNRDRAIVLVSGSVLDRATQCSSIVIEKVEEQGRQER